MRSIANLIFMGIFLNMVNYFQSSLKAQELEKPLQIKSKHIDATVAVLYSGSMVALHQLWYKDYGSSKFHFFNDAGEWKGMDKVGHFVTANRVNSGIYAMYTASGFSPQRAMWRSAIISTAFQTTVEVFDGFSTAWGFSWADIASNTAGTAAFCLQQQFFKEQLVKFKFSFWPSKFNKYRPSLLGQSFPNTLLKDYNAQTYWASFSLARATGFSKLPAWLCLSFGYGVNALTGARVNSSIDGLLPPSNELRASEFSLGIDIDLVKIKTRHRWLRRCFNVVNIIRLPLPAVTYLSTGTTKFNFIKF